MKIIECEQGSERWFKAKCGIPSASNFHMIITSKGTPSKQREKYLFRLAGEVATGIVEESYQSAAMLKGKELEAEARKLYRLIKGVKVKEVGFCLANGCGASPDGLVGKPGLLEIKCPIMSTHIGYLINNNLHTDYFQQGQGQLLVTGRKWIDFMSYYAGMKPLIVRVKRDKRFLFILEKELKTFRAELNKLTRRIKQ